MPHALITSTDPALSQAQSNGRSRVVLMSESNSCPLCKLQRVFDIDAKVADRAYSLRMTEQDLRRTQMSRRLVYIRCLRASKRVNAVILGLKSIKPSEQGPAGWLDDLELHGSSGLLVHFDDAIPDPVVGNDADLDDIATAQLAIDREVEERSVPMPVLVQPKSKSPNLLPFRVRSALRTRPSFQGGVRQTLDLRRVPIAYPPVSSYSAAYSGKGN